MEGEELVNVLLNDLKESIIPVDEDARASAQNHVITSYSIHYTKLYEYRRTGKMVILPETGW